ncbi:MAG: multidrug ABC transporter ATP-binding protein, partial [Thalassococcus sp.]|nr:multidrug ABC transporter ATP-binding protein [Thalassococcus sp.]
EAIADRIGVISGGQLLLVEEKDALMQRLGQKQLCIELQQSLSELPEALSDFDLDLCDDGASLVYTYDTAAERTGIARLIAALTAEGLNVRDIQTRQKSLEDIFVDLVHNTGNKEDAA